MSFTWFRPEGRLDSPESIAQRVHTVAVARGLTDLVYTHCALACIKVESDFWCPWNAAAPGSNSFPYDSQSDDGRSVGYFQQQTGPPPDYAPWWGTVQDEMTLERAADTFLSRLPDGLSYSMGSAVLGEHVADTQQCAPAYRGRYAEEWDGVAPLLAALGKPPVSVTPGTPPLPEPTPPQ